MQNCSSDEQRWFFDFQLFPVSLSNENFSMQFVEIYWTKFLMGLKILDLKIAIHLRDSVVLSIPT